jgi:hypothetical protein
MPERRRRVYLDTSSYLVLLIDEEAAVDMRGDLAGAEVVSSVLLMLETRRNLVRLARERSLSAEHYHAAMARVAADADGFLLRDLTLDLCEGFPLPAVATPRALDLAHLRTALWFHRNEPIDRFITLDTAQRDAARELGLPVG